MHTVLRPFMVVSFSTLLYVVYLCVLTTPFSKNVSHSKTLRLLDKYDIQLLWSNFVNETTSANLRLSVKTERYATDRPGQIFEQNYKLLNQTNYSKSVINSVDSTNNLTIPIFKSGIARNKTKDDNYVRVMNSSIPIAENTKPEIIYDIDGHIVRNDSRVEFQDGSMLPLFKNYRNPCWSEIYNKLPKIRCLPYFFLIGAPKCGTTDLFRRMSFHPLISSNVTKEPHWLTRTRFYSGNHHLTEYLRIFGQAARDIQRQKDNDGYHGMIVGDSSASTVWFNTHISHNMSGGYTNAEIIYKLNKHAKIIVILRHPVARMHSDYFYFNLTGTAGSFHSYVVEQISKFKTCLTMFTLEQCLYRSTDKNRVKIGIYYEHLKYFFNTFPRKQIMVIKSEDYAIQSSQTIKNVFNFLGIGMPPLSDWSVIANHKHKANQRPASSRMKMLPETKEMLRAFYRPYNEKLVQLLGNKFNYNL